MVTKSKTDGTKKGRIKVGKLKLNKETVKDLTSKEAKQIKGGTDTIVGCIAVTVAATVGVSLAVCGRRTK
jgi:natural product precursor